MEQGVKFTPVTVTYQRGSPIAIISGDFNRDGKIDLVAGGFGFDEQTLEMLLGKGDGTFRPAGTSSAGDFPSSIIAADLNRDGKLDLVISTATAGGPGFPSGISILGGRGDGSFGITGRYFVIANLGLAVADLNGDGWPDLIAFSDDVIPFSNSHGAVVLLNRGNAGLQKSRTYFFPQYFSIGAVKDVNGDGRADLVAIGASSEITNVNVLLGNGDGTFQSPIVSSANVAYRPGAIAIEDFDRDGKPDIVVTGEFLTVWKGNGDGTFVVPASQLRLKAPSRDLKVADFNGDGKLDLVSAGTGLEILLGNGDGTFQVAGVLTGGVGPILTTDLNGDTRPDLVAGNVVLLNVTPGDLNNTDYFVHQHYVDFLNREPDALGFNFWTNQINSCGADQQCIELKRDNVSAAFFLSIEFQQTAYLVERLYKTAYGDAVGTSTFGGAHQFSVPIVRFNEHLMDTRQIGQDVIVGQPGWDTVLENNKQSFFVQFVARPRFTTALPTTLTPTQFIDAMNQNAGYVLSPTERATAIALFRTVTDTSDWMARAQALKQIAENQNLYNAEFNRAFVLTEYFGYLRRNPNEGQDTDYSGYDFWLNKLNFFNGDYQKAEMVKAFITSDEYRKRFGP